MRYSLRWFSLASALLVVSACGGGDSTPPVAPNPPVTPPPTLGPPASVAAQSQVLVDGEPGTVVAGRPAVVVRDAAGRALPNISVTFSVDSGGGVVTGGSASTGADGVASLGEWRLGPQEGRQIVSARVASLTPVSFVANALQPAISLPPQPLTGTGGTVVLSRPGHPADGTNIVVPTGALVAPVSLTFGLRSSAAIVLPTGTRAAGPVVQVNAVGALLNEPVLLTLPIAEVAGSLRIVSVIEQGTGRLIPLTLVEQSSTSVTVALPVLDPLAQRTSAQQRGGASNLSFMRVERAAGGSVAGGPEESLLEILGSFHILEEKGDIDTGFRPGVDDWDFRRQPIAGIPNFSPGPTVDPAAAMVESARWYFANRKAADGPLWRRFRIEAGIPESNRRGLRWMGVAGSLMPVRFFSSQAYSSLRARFGTPVGVDGTQQLFRIKYAMSGDRSALGLPPLPPTPVPVLLFAGTSAEAPRYGLAYRVVGRTVEIALPEEPGKVFPVEFLENGIRPFTVSTFGGGTYTVTGVSQTMLELSNGLRTDLQLPQHWPQVVAGTIGEAQRWRRPALKGWFLPKVGDAKLVSLDTARVFLQEDFTHWFECVGCAENGFRLGTPVGNVNALLFRLAMPSASGTFTTLPEAQFSSSTLDRNDVTPSESIVAGYALYLPGPGSALESPQNPSWFDWVTVRYRRLPVTMSPSDLTFLGNETIALSVTAPGAPTGSTYRWTFEGSVTESFNTTVPQLSYALKRSKMIELNNKGSAKMKVEVLDADGRPIGEVEKFLEIDAPLMLAWRFTSVSLQYSTTGPNISSDVRWRTDTTRLTRIRDGGSQSGVRVVATAFDPPGFPIRSAPEGLYLLEGASLTAQTLEAPESTNSFASAPFPGVALPLPAAPRVNGWNLVRTVQTTPLPTCADPRERFQRTGTATNGRVTAFTVQTCWPRGLSDFPWLSGLPTITTEADVTYTDTSASGTITLTYWFYHNQGNTVQTKRVQATFQATRIPD